MSHFVSLEIQHGSAFSKFDEIHSITTLLTKLDYLFSCSFRDENRTTEATYDGPAGMEVGGIIESNWDEVVDNFDAMNLKEKLLRGIYAYGFEKPSAIQQRAIIPCIKGRDVIAQAQSGKTSLKVTGFSLEN